MLKLLHFLAVTHPLTSKKFFQGYCSNILSFFRRNSHFKYHNERKNESEIVKVDYTANSTCSISSILKCFVVQKSCHLRFFQTKGFFVLCHSKIQSTITMVSVSTIQGQLQRWTEHSTLIFENLKPVEKSKNHFSII